MCPNTAMYLASSYSSYICAPASTARQQQVPRCALARPHSAYMRYMCPHTAVYVPYYCYVYGVLILLYIERPHTYVSARASLSLSNTNIHPSIHPSIHPYIHTYIHIYAARGPCGPFEALLLHVCPHTAICVCPHTTVYACCALARLLKKKMLIYADVCRRMLTYADVCRRTI